MNEEAIESQVGNLNITTKPFIPRSKKQETLNLQDEGFPQGLINQLPTDQTQVHD